MNFLKKLFTWGKIEQGAGDWLIILPYWFGLTIGLIYATGFLIDYTFYNSIGIHDRYDSFLRAKYVHIGVICAYAPISIGLLLHGVLITKREKKERSYWATAITIVLVLLTVDSLTAFVSPGFFQNENLRIAFIFIVAVGGVSALRFAEEIRDIKKPVSLLQRLLRSESNRSSSEQKHLHSKRYSLAIICLAGVELAIIAVRGIPFQPLADSYPYLSEWPSCIVGFIVGLIIGILTFKSDHRWRSGPRWLILLITALGISITFQSQRPLAREMLIEGGWFYVVLLVLVFFIGLTMVYSKISPKNILFVVSLLLPMALLYFSVIVFAYRIYPYIPYSRGGGDYSRGQRASILCFGKSGENALPKEIVDGQDLSFTPEDFADASGFISHVFSDHDNVSHLIITIIKDASEDDLDLLRNSHVSNADKMVILCEYLNWIIRTPHVFEGTLVDQRQIYSKQLSLPEDYSYNSDVIQANKNILESTFFEIRKMNANRVATLSWPVTILDETPTTLYVTPEILESTRANWRKLGPNNKPRVICEIKRENVISVMYHVIYASFP